MDLQNKNLSLQFYEYLCNIVGSEEVIRSRRKIFTAKDIVDSTTDITAISSGSKSEGLDLKGSDYDQMIVFSRFRVYEILNDDHSNPDKIPLAMDTNDTKPGFTKLTLVNQSYLDIIRDWCEAMGEETYISSKRFREEDLPGDMIIHGPCHSTAGGQYDFALCFRCKEWIKPAQQWIHRSRTTWPHYTLVTAAVQYGVLFVPIGCKNSPNEDLQWRISFSETEKLLICSFSHTQLLCYALMKIIVKDLINPRHGDLLCSYFIKTIMLWLSEEMSPSAWKPENTIPCFFDCIKRLIYCVEYKTCLHYFIPEYNLFEERFTDKEHQALLNTLLFIYESPWISVFETSTFQNYRLESVKSHGMILSASELSCYCYLKNPRVSSINSAITRLVNVRLNKELCTYMISEYAKSVLNRSHIFNMIARNKSFYQQYRTSVCYFKISLRSSSINTWLLVASLFYNCKRYQECLHILKNNLFGCTQDKIYLRFANTLAEQTVFKQIKQKFGLLEAFRYLMIDDAYFIYPFCFLPAELISLITAKLLIFPPVVYSYLLQILCCHHVGDYRGKNEALHNLVLAKREQYLINPKKNISRIVQKSIEIVLI